MTHLPGIRIERGVGHGRRLGHPETRHQCNGEREGEPGRAHGPILEWAGGDSLATKKWRQAARFMMESCLWPRFGTVRDGCAQYAPPLRPPVFACVRYRI